MGRKRVAINPECGERVKKAKKAYGHTFDDLASILSCDRNHVSNIVRGKRNLTPDMARRMVETAFPGIRYEWLLCWDNFRTEEEKELNRQKEEIVKSAAEYEYQMRAVIEELLYRETGYQLMNEVQLQQYGRCIGVYDTNKKQTGFAEMDALESILEQAENYISYLLKKFVEEDVTFNPSRLEEGGHNG